MWQLRHAAVASLILLSLAAASAAAAPNAPIDPVVQQQAAQGGSIPVLVYGRLAAAPATLTGARKLGDLAFAGSVNAGDLAALAASPDVVYVGPDSPVQPTANPHSQGGSAAPSGARSVFPAVDGAPTAWGRGFTGAGVGIAVVDSGESRDNDLGGRLVTVTGVDGGNDTYGHGSLVASVAAGASPDGQFAGVAPGATVVAVNVSNPNGVRTSDVIAGLQWVQQNRLQYNIRVVNLSLTETTPSSYLSDLLDTVVEQLWQSGVAVVVSAGNLGPGSAAYAPANDPFAISVGATDTEGTVDPSDDVVAPWSTSGTTPDGFAKPELLAPGRLVIGWLPWTSALGRLAPDDNWVVKHAYAMISGTSFSAPQVAGAAAVLLQQHPDWSPDQIKAVVESTARPVAGSAAGALDLAAATAYAGVPAPADPGVAYSTFGLAPSPDAGVSPGGNSGYSNQSGWNHSGWNHSGWNNSSWNHSGWNNSGWNNLG